MKHVNIILPLALQCHQGEHAKMVCPNHYACTLKSLLGLAQEALHANLCD